MLKVGFVGWRGMVGSVLMQRMQEDGDFNGIEPIFSPLLKLANPAPTSAWTCLR
ncbi:hypothetical protein HAALTHF_34380n [Vreelandella aquamarina]|nr:hypothetical protein HAALTHF_34380n [Halomonas axialensis]